MSKSKDIRSYFVTKKVQKAKIEDDDDVIPESPDVQIKNKKKESRKKRILCDDSDEEIFASKKKKPDQDSNKVYSKNKQKTPNKPALQEVKAIDMFGSGPIKRTEPLVKKVKKNTETGIHSDEEFEKILLDVDAIEELVTQDVKKEKSPIQTKEIEIIDVDKEKSLEVKKQESGTSNNQPADISSKTKVHKSKHSSNLDSNNKIRSVENGESSKERTKAASVVSSDKKEKKTETTDVKKETKNHEKDKSEKKKLESSFNNKDSKRVENGESTPKIEKKRYFSEFVEGNDSVNECDTPRNKKKKLDQSLNDSVLTDEERHERKRYSSALYQKYLNRSGPKHLGAKQIPEGPPNCLKDCAFLLTGVLESFEREEVVEAITKYGGCVKNSMSKKVTHVLAGDDAGPAKMAKAQELGIRIINEDEFLQMIAEKKTSKLEIKELKHEKSPSRKSSKKSPKDKKSDSKIKDKVKSESRPKDESKTASNHVKKETEAKSIEKVNHEEKADTKSETKSSDSIVGLNGIKTQSSNAIVTPSSTMWVEKYKPQSVKQIIGQHGDASNVKKLTNWLTKWYMNRKAKLPKPSPWAKNDDGGYYKAALLSGPPGVGKTTTVALVCKELGFDTVEFNASDTRNRTLIKEQIGELLTTTSLSAYAKGDTSKQAVTKKHVLVMDEVDGMSGNEDRGGMQELIGLIKSASVPIICMCNDRNSQKMRSLVNYCYDLRFSRPRVDQIKAAMMSICYKEGIKIPPDVLTQLIIAANQDVRQTLNLLSMWSVDSNLADTDRLKSEAKGVRKDLKLGPWEVIRKVFSAEEHKTMSLIDKSDLFFHDYSLAPLFVQENYLQVAPHCPKHEVLERISKAADSISAGDLIDARIRSKQAWSLLPIQAMYSSVIPGHALSGHVAGQIQFPGWLGKNSRANKMHRLCQEIHAHTRLSTSGSKSSIFLDYCTYLRDAIVTPLLKDKADGVAKSLEVLEAYHLLREDLDSLTELSLWPGQRNPMILIDSKIKAAMTRTYNKSAMALPYAPGAVRKGRARDDDPIGDEEEMDAEDVGESDSDPENDALIKKKKVKEEKASTNKDKAGSSKEKASSKKERPSSSKSKKK